MWVRRGLHRYLLHRRWRRHAPSIDRDQRCPEEWLVSHPSPNKDTRDRGISGCCGGLVGRGCLALISVRPERVVWLISFSRGLCSAPDSVATAHREGRPRAVAWCRRTSEQRPVPPPAASLIHR